MSKLTIKGKTQLFGIEVPQIYGGFGDNQKVMLAKTIAEIHGRELFNVNKLINENRKRFIDGEHILDLKGNEAVAITLKNSGIMTQNAINASTNIYLLSQRGYVRLLKIMDDDVAWEKWDVIETDYFEMKEKQTLPQSIEDLIIMQAQSVKELKTQVSQHGEAIIKIESGVQSIRDVVALNTTNWREDTKNLITRIAEKLGGFEHIQNVRKESYKQLNARINVSLERRVTNKRQRMALEGVCKSKIDKINPLDVIGEDPKLLEAYVAIVKEMAIKYGAA